MKPVASFDNLLVVVLAAAFSLVTLWLIDSWIKYPLFIFEILAIVTIYLICINHRLNVDFTQTFFSKVKTSLVIDAFLIFSALALFVFNSAFNTGSPIQLALSVLVTSLLPGYALLGIFKLDIHFSKLEKVVLSFILSYAFTGFLSLVFLTTGGITKNALFASSYIIVGLISAIRHQKQAPYQNPSSLARNFDVFPLLLIVGFYVLSYLLIYPNFALIPGTDVSQHFGRSLLLNRSPDFYIGSTYLFAHLHEASFIYLANSSLVDTQSALIALNLMLPLAFYVVAKPFLERIDSRLPSLATVFWVLLTNSFGGFSWLYFSAVKFLNPFESQMSLLSFTAEKTYNGTIYGVLGLWFVPATVSIVFMLTMLFLLTKKDIPSVKYLPLFAIIVAVLYLTHVAEAVIAVAFIALYAIFSKNQFIKFRHAIIASLLGFILAAIVYIGFSQVTPRFMFSSALLASLLLPSILLIASLGAHRYFSGKTWRLSIKRVLSLRTLAVALFVAYITISLSFFWFADSFYTSEVNYLGFVPLFIYPLMVGVTGFLSIVSIYYIARDQRNFSSLKFMATFAVFAFIVGILVSIANLYFSEVNFWEKRFIWFIKIPLAMLAPIPVVLFIEKLHKGLRQKRVKIAVSVLLISLISMFGMSTVFLNVEYWNSSTQDSSNYLSSQQLAAVEHFQKILDKDTKAWAVTVTSDSLATMAFVEPADTLQLQPLLYNIHTRELGFTQLYRSSTFSHPYAYIDARDASFLKQIWFRGQFLANYLPTVPVAYQNEQVTIYNISKISYPELSSTTALIVPFDRSAGSNVAVVYDVLSLGFYNYTVAYDLDTGALNYPLVVVSFDPPHNQTLNTRAFNDYFDYLNSGGKLVVVNSNVEAGLFAQQLFAPSRSEITAKAINGRLLPDEVSVPVATVIDGVKVLSQYEGDDAACPFILQRDYSNGGQLVYVNMYPLISAMRFSPDRPDYTDLLGHLLDGVGLPKASPSKPLDSIDGYVRRIYLEDNVKVESSQMIFPQNLTVNWARLRVGDVTYDFSKVTSIKISDYSHVSLAADAASIRNGTGFYTRIELPSSFSIEPADASFTVEVTGRNGTFTLHDVSQLTVESKYGVELFARTPTVSADVAVFIELYLDHLGVAFSGQNLQTYSFTQFTINIGDNYKALSNLTIGAFSNAAPAYDYLTVLFQVVLISAFTSVSATAILVFYKRHKNSTASMTGR